MPILINSSIAPRNPDAPTHLAEYGKGGLYA